MAQSQAGEKGPARAARWWGAVLVFCAGLCQAQSPPTNDLCAGAQEVPGAGPFPYLTAVTPDVSLTTTNGDPALRGACIGLSNSLTRSIWYRFRPTTSAQYGLSVGPDTATTVSDTIMAVYSSSSGGCAGPLVQIACEDDAGGDSSHAALFLSLSANTTYYVVIWVFGDSEDPLPLDPSETAVQLRVSRLVAPSNDNCAGAIEIPAAGPFPHTTTTNDTAVATETGDPPAPSCEESDFYRSVWFRFRPSQTTTYSLSTGTETATTVGNPILAIYSAGSCGGPFTPVACDFDILGRAMITTTLQASTTYYLVVWDFELDPIPGLTQVQLRVGKLAQPSVTTTPASSITSTSAVLNASINPNVGMTRYWFEWGTTTNYGNATLPTTLPPGTLNVPVGTKIAGLTGGVTYQYRAVATNTVGKTLGANRSFSWSNARPQMLSYQLLTNGNFRIEFTGMAAQMYRVQASTTLTSWEDAGEAAGLGNGRFRFEDSGADVRPNRFYRIVSP